MQLCTKILAIFVVACDAGTESSTCSSGSTGPALLQHSNQVVKANLTSGRRVTSDCAQRLNHFSERTSACLVIRGNQALLVKVNYGSSPGWDFPGGYKKSRESACETAERETCEETGTSVRAVAKLTYNVFKCEVIEENACRRAVDEGFLQKKWITKDQIDSLTLRGGTWGDKRSLLREHLSSSGTSAPAGEPDACGCIPPKGWSSTRQRCSSSSSTSVSEAAACTGEADQCGCVPPEGWSSTYQVCRSGSRTSESEASQCMNTSPDACGCIFPEGWSSTVKRCRSSSTTSGQEAENCRAMAQ
eukprot:TRINITY_DN94933_c0_g1_i1.p1 TRINITY_DN94933_c0_g1~~TRINITY_DN94933_c0_g1_i1.p1  ORF type:complete len:332 (-),score=59.92 TRINITY_DN94933_c0_g1_i1:150-1058(-)